MTCDFCGRLLTENEVVHGIRFGRVDLMSDLFLPAKDSAATIICAGCGSAVLKVVYSGLKRVTLR